MDSKTIYTEYPYVGQHHWEHTLSIGSCDSGHGEHLVDNTSIRTSTYPVPVLDRPQKTQASAARFHPMTISWSECVLMHTESHRITRAGVNGCITTIT